MGKSAALKIGIGLVALLLVGYFYLTADRTRSFNWNLHFNPDSKDPYGCFLLYELLNESVGAEGFDKIDQPVSNAFETFEGKDANYLFVGLNWYYSEKDIASLADFVSKGNNAYVIAENFPYEILNEMGIYSAIFFDTFTQTEVSIAMADIEPIPIPYLDEWEKELYIWTYADSITHDDIHVLGRYEENKLNYLKVNYGDGSMFFHFVPLVFANFHLKDEEKLTYANEVFSEFNDGHIFWDNFSGIPSDDYGITQSPLSFVLSQESLRWAWYMLLCLGILYILFYTKRRQRVMPVVNPIKNTSIDFVKTIGAIYYHEESAQKIIAHQKRLLLTYIHTRYGISPGNESFLKKASLKSGVPEAEIDMILKEAKRLQLRGELTNKDLVDYNKLTENFYRNSN